jgi:selenide,water dikinase
VSDVLVDQEHSDDAAVVRPGPGGQLLVLTADVIAPLVDDAAVFGQIAAANAMSDVWAMGGEPRFALNLVFFPDELLPLDVLYEILDGAAAACAAAGVAIVGGHSVRDPELKFGQSITGEVAPGSVWSNRGGRAGQALVLTKALGTGVVAQGAQAGRRQRRRDRRRGDLDDPRSTATPRRWAIATASPPATDVTGFGLLGHLRNVLRGSGLSAHVELAELPLLPGALDLLRGGFLPGGSKANRKGVAASLRWADGAPVAAALPALPAMEGAGSSVAERELRLALACDAQTSGGLLLCVPAERAAACVAELRSLGLPAAQIGRLTAPEPTKLTKLIEPTEAAEPGTAGRPDVGAITLS